MSLGNDGGIPAVMNVTPTGTISSGSGGMGWGNDGSWWIIILFLFIFAGGWNRNGWGGNGNGETAIGTPTLYKDSKGQTCVSLPLISHTISSTSNT